MITISTNFSKHHLNKISNLNKLNQEENIKMNETMEFNHKKIIKENLKIVVENKGIGGANENDLLDYDEMETDDNVNSNVAVINAPINNNRNVEIGGDNDVNQLGQNEEDETEFHVNLDKVPPTLQNTILVILLKLLIRF